MASIFSTDPDPRGTHIPVFSLLPTRSEETSMTFALETSLTFSRSSGYWDPMSTKSRQDQMTLSKDQQSSLRLFAESCQIEARRRTSIGAEAVLHYVE